jgi:MFS family permease
MYLYLLPFAVFNYMVALGFFSFYWGRHEKIYVGSIVGVVCLVSAVCGMIGATEKATIQLNGQTFLWCRLMEYTINTPLLTATMGEAFGCESHKVLRLTSLSASYCLCGFGAVLTTRWWLKIYFVALGCLLCGFVSLRLIQVSRNPPYQSKVAQVNLVMMCISYPLVICTWGLTDIWRVMPPKHEILLETLLMIFIKTTAILYVVGDEEWLKIQNMMYELPSHIFYVARSILFNH